MTRRLAAWHRCHERQCGPEENYSGMCEAHLALEAHDREHDR